MDWLDRLHIYYIDAGNEAAPDSWVYHYQTLIAGGLALVAAFFTVLFIPRQIAVSESQHREILSRQYRSVRASLPFALSQLNSYAEECSQLLQSIMQGKEEDEDLEMEIECPSLPETSAKTITELIALASENDARKLQALVRFMQIQNSRLTSKFLELSPSNSPGSIVIKQNLRHDVLDTCILLKMTNLFYPFARWEVDEVPDFDGSGLTGLMEYTVSTSFDEKTVEYVKEKLLKFTAYAFEPRRQH